MRVVNNLDLIQHLKLWDKMQGQWIRFILWPIQVKWIKTIYSSLRVISLKKRQVGLSQLTGADSLLQCLTQKNFTCLILSITAEDARVFLDRIRGMYEQVPTSKEIGERIKAGEKIPDQLLKLVGLKEYNKATKGAEAGEEMKFASGSSIVSLSARKGRGRTADRVVLDEAAFYTKKLAHITLDEVLKGIAPTLDRSGGQLIIISTANGLNIYYNYWRKAVAKVSGFVAFFISCWDDPDFTKQKRQDIINEHGEDHANQEYPRTPKEAFLSSGRPRFNLGLIDKYYEPNMVKPIARGNIKIDSSGRQYVEIHPDGDIYFYKKKDPRGIYLISADVAEGLNQDASVFKVFELPSMETVALYINNKIEPTFFGEVLALAGRHWNNAVLAPEKNNHGASSIAVIRHKMKYPQALIHVSKLKHKEIEQDKFMKPEERFGFVTTGANRSVIIDQYAMKLQTRKVPYLVEQEIMEHQTFVVNNAGKAEAEEGEHDDIILATCIGSYLSANYIKRDVDPFNKCGNCNEFKQVNEMSGFCKRSLRWTSGMDYCRLWKLLSSGFKIKEAYASGYAPN